MSPTKLVEPGLPAGYVARPRLHEQLTDGVDHLVTVLSAHAGTGKTVLLGSWARGRGDVAWLTLDRDDNWSPRFWRGIDLALDRVDSRPTTKSANANGEDPAFRIGERIATLRRPVILVLDDFHEIESPIVLREVDTLLSNAPPTLRVVLATRSDPHLRLQRLRLAGDFAEIRAVDLAFAPDECRELLDEAGAELSDDEVRSLWERTEGWAAGVRLAALSLEHEQDPSNFVAHFAGDERAVADYLLTEILDRQAADRREFLLRTCVPESLSADLAASLSGNRSAGRLLGELEKENFFVSRHDEAGDLYRLHALLRDFLRANLAAARPEEHKLLNRRCARWYWDHGEVDLAFRHALAGEDWDLADELTAEAWHIVVFGVDARPWDASTSIPEAALVGRPALALRGAAAMLAMGDRVSAEACSERAAAELESWPPERRAMVAPLLVAFRIGLARLDSDYAAMRELGLELLSVPRAGTFEVGRRVGAERAIAATVIGAAQLAYGEFDDAEVSLERSLAQAREVGIDIVTLNSLSELGLLEAARGRLRRAVAYGLEAVEYAERRGWSQLHHLSGARLALAWAYYNWDELQAAKRQVDDAAAAAQYWDDRLGKVGSAVIASLLSATGGPDGAAQGLRLLRGARTDLNGWTAPTWLARLVPSAETRLLAARGDFDEARDALEGQPQRDGYAVEASLLRARIMLASGSTADALEQLEEAKPKSLELDLPRRIESGVLEAVARRGLNDRAGAAEAIEAALALAEPNSYRRQFVDGGPAVKALLVEQIRRGTDHRALVADLIAAFDRRATDVAITKTELLEPLSERERAVLRYLPTLMSNAEIASELFLSVNTVKTHLKSIYRKLGAARRREAVERARRIELL